MKRILSSRQWLYALVLIFVVATYLPGGDVPRSILAGIMAVESGSYFKPDGTIVYVDRRIGAAGEHGPFQMRMVALRQVHLGSEWLPLIQSDPIAAEYAAELYLSYCYHCTGSWRKAVERFHGGSRAERRRYADRVFNLAE